MSFPDGFMWGAATASYQIEGAAREDGRGECIWTRFSHTPGKVYKGDTGDIACDHYHRYRDDIALMQQLKLDAYRFSISWPRVIPDGTGAVNEAGLDFYDRLVDSLLEAQITPTVTLYHWDLPQALQDRGGWLNAASVHWFADYTRLMVERLGDRVQHWITHNEPWVVAFVGHYEGRHAPGITDPVAAYRVAHHLLISHGHAMQIIRENSEQHQAGITLNLHPMYPASDDPADQAAARREDGYLNRWFLEPVMKGHYPQDMVEHLGELLRGVDDLDAVQPAAAPADFLGINHYTRNVIRHSDTGDFRQIEQILPEGNPYTTMGWEVYPQGFTELLLRVTRDYQPPAIWVTENGSAWPDEAPNDLNGVLEDPQRVATLTQYLAALENAIDQGAPVTAYFAWSLLDNFEWALGYSQRFGLIHVDYTTQKRTLKRSALTYRAFIESH